MFNYQSEERDKLIPKKYVKLYEWWREEFPELVSKKKNHYLDKAFYDWVVVKMVKENLYKEEFGEMLDLHVRKFMTSSKFIKTHPEQKDDFYSMAIQFVYRYGIPKVDLDRSSFVYFTSAIRSGIFQVIKDDNKDINNIRQMLWDNGTSMLTSNNDGNINEMDDSIYKQLRQEKFELGDL